MQCAETEAETVAERNREHDYYQNSTTNRQQSTIWCTSNVGNSWEKEENSRNGSRPQFQDLSKSIREAAQWDTSETIPAGLPMNQHCGQRSQYVYWRQKICSKHQKFEESFGSEMAMHN